MRMNTYSLMWVLASALTLSACGEETAPANDSPIMSDQMPGMEEREKAGTEHAATGTLNSVDLAGGTVNISHEPVPSIGWPEMTMSFKLANPEDAADLKPGQRVEFNFTTEGGATVTRISVAE